MFVCEIWFFDWYFFQFCTSDMSKYGYLEVFQRVPLTSRYRESTVSESKFSGISTPLYKRAKFRKCSYSCYFKVLLSHSKYFEISVVINLDFEISRDDCTRY